MTTTLKKGQLMPLKELAPHTPYAVGYLSLMARRGNLKVEKVKGTWYSTMENVKTFEELMKKRKEDRRKALSARYKKKVGPKIETKKKVSLTGKGTIKGITIFDEVQKDLKEVLKEIRDKEREIKKEYREYRKRSKKEVVTASEIKRINAKIKGDDLAEKLILDLGKLINTANQVQEEVEKIEEKKIDKDELVSVPIITSEKPIPQNKLYDALEKNTKKKDLEDADLSLYPNYPAPLPFEDEKRGGSQQMIINGILIAIFIAILFFMFIFIAFG